MKHTLDQYRSRWSRDPVVAAPSVSIARGATVRTYALFGGLAGVALTLSGIIGLANGVYHDSDLNELLIVAVWAAVGFALAGAGVGVHRLTRAHERKHGVLIAADIEAAPQTLSLPLLDALTAADTIRESRAYRDHWLTNVDLDAALWDLAQHVKTGTEIQQALDGASESADAATLEEGRAALDRCTAHVEAGAARLADLAGRVSAFDHELNEPDRRAKLEQARARRDRIEAQHCARLVTATADLAVIAPAVDDTADRIAGQLDAYTASPGMAREM
ncbi:hypothetical protein GS481_02910 [Rhodococcus hoagii]|nr:hypothetical protein [Prescottella equi]NKR53106.1 hypothetical protein [Prescottella equi]